jgi:hypothetical protein
MYDLNFLLRTKDQQITNSKQLFCYHARQHEVRLINLFDLFLSVKHTVMTERDLRKLEGTIRTKMEEIKKQRVSLKDSGIGGLMNMLKKADEALYEKILPEYKKMVADYNIFK